VRAITVVKYISLLALCNSNIWEKGMPCLFSGKEKSWQLKHYRALVNACSLFILTILVIYIGHNVPCKILG